MSAFVPQKHHARPHDGPGLQVPHCKSLFNCDRSDALVRNIRVLVVALLRLVAEPGDPRQVDADELPVALHHLAGDQHGVDVLRAHAGDHRADRVVHRHDVEHVGAQQDDVGLLAGRQRADLALEAVGARAFDGGKFEHVACCQELRRVLVAGKPARPRLVLLQREDRAYLREEVVRHRSFDVDLSDGRMPSVDRLLDRRLAVPHQRFDIAGDRDGPAGVLDQLPLRVVEHAAMDVGRVRFQRLHGIELFQKRAAAELADADMDGDARADVAGGLKAAGSARARPGPCQEQRHQLVFAGEILLAQASDVAGIFVAWLFP